MLQRLSKVLRVPLPRLTRALEAGQGRPADADPRQDGRARGPGRDPARAAARVPRASRSWSTYLRNYENRALGGAGARLRGRDLAGGAQPGSRTTATAAATRSARPASRRRSTRTSAARRAPRSSASTRSAARRARAVRPSAGRRSPGNNVRLTLDVGLQRAAERALRDGIDLGSRTTSRSTRTAARSSRSTRATARCSRWPPTRPTSRPSTSAASIRRSSSR